MGGIDSNVFVAAEEFAEILEKQDRVKVASDTVDINREKVFSVMTDLLIGNSEQEQKLLEFIINKIDDSKSKVASKAVCCLNKLLHEHPAMKVVVLKEIEKLLFRPNVGQRAQYYAICLLAQYVLDKDDECSTTLIDLYFAFFKACLKKGEADSRMMAAILTGVNRDYRFANLNIIKLNKHINSVYKVVHVGSFNVLLNALSLLHQVVVMMKDQSVSRVFAFIKRVLQVSAYFPANMTCAVLYKMCYQRIDYSGNPLKDLTMRFLDRYVFKNPKKLDGKIIDNTNDSHPCVA
ncbi:hypothetical protein HCN44_001684 [Aphidius gifuensis]|uniref:CCAAT-binding factor domain-containing protein n=1 Tax=Aphidius gifuensis TaxID=684658 RepID=A0A835CR13_APHGI|nr:hypothetical protein HCN44_001684 [Aphidius gifuensis]